MKNKKMFYEIIFSVLALITVTMSILDLYGKIKLTPYNAYYMIDLSILIIFIVDYCIRLYLSQDKRDFIKDNIPDLIAIIPFNSLFKVFRIAKLLRFTKLFKFFRLAGVSGKFYKNANRFLKTNGLIYALFFTATIILIGTISISLTEKMSIPDALWWSFVTTTTVGYGDISPTTGIGRIIAGILMLVGIGTIGMLTGTIATYFLEKNENLSEDNPITKLVQSSSDLSDTEKQEVLQYIHFIKSRQKF